MARAPADHLGHAVPRHDAHHVATVPADRWDWVLLIGPFGLFACLYLAFLRLMPAVSMHEMRSLVSREGAP